jgi:hypothetical protein
MEILFQREQTAMTLEKSNYSELFGLTVLFMRNMKRFIFGLFCSRFLNAI